MEKYILMAGRLLDIRLKGSTTRLAAGALILVGAYNFFLGNVVEGAESWAIGAGLWGLRDAIE